MPLKKRPRCTTLLSPTFMTLSRVVIKLLAATVTSRIGWRSALSVMPCRVRGAHLVYMA